MSRAPKKIWLIGILGAIAVAVIACFLVITLTSDIRFELGNEFYGHGTIESVETAELRQMIDDKKSFAVFVSQPDCRTADAFRAVLEEFLAAHPMQFFEIAFSDLRSSGLAPEVRFYPSFIIFREGKLVAFLDADSAADAEAYSSLSAFTAWLEKYLILKS